MIICKMSRIKQIILIMETILVIIIKSPVYKIKKKQLLINKEYFKV